MEYERSVSQAHYSEFYDPVKDRSKSHAMSMFCKNPLFIERNRYWQKSVQPYNDFILESSVLQYKLKYTSAIQKAHTDLQTFEVIHCSFQMGVV